MKIAQRFIDAYGKDEFCKILNSKLSSDNFDDDKGYIYLAIISMGIGTIYTTNQDNIMEKCCEKHGFEYKSIITIEDLISAKIGEGLYIKYHGDYSVPESVIFGEDEYLDRIDDKDNFIDTKLKANVLGRSLLFIRSKKLEKSVALQPEWSIIIVLPGAYGKEISVPWS